MIKLKSSGGFTKTKKFLKNISGDDLTLKEIKGLKDYANNLIRDLEAATPRDTGLTANSWSYTITMSGDKVRLDIFNSNVVDGCCVALLLQYGHGTRSGTYVPGIDYINPAVKPYFDRIESKVWKEVTA